MSPTNSQDIALADRHAEAWRKLATVVDPELDEPVTEMGFISTLEVDASDCVHVGFRLPTYWCAANFAFMMADDMRSALRSLGWVKDTRIVLGDHMYADVINRGVAEGLSFEETFGSEAAGNLDEVRRTFLLKAFQRRQEALMQYLLGMGKSRNAICAMSIADLYSVRLKLDGRNLVTRYLDRRAVIGAHTPGSPAFLTADGQGIEPDCLDTYLAVLRRVRANAEFNGALCRGLLAVRFDMETPLSPRKPTTPNSNPASIS